VEAVLDGTGRRHVIGLFSGLVRTHLGKRASENNRIRTWRSTKEGANQEEVKHGRRAHANSTWMGASLGSFI